MIVSRAAVAQVVAELDRRRHAVTDRDQLSDRFLPEIDRPRLVIALPCNYLLALVPFQRDAVVVQVRRDRRDLADPIPPHPRHQPPPPPLHHVLLPPPPPPPPRD